MNPDMVEMSLSTIWSRDAMSIKNMSSWRQYQEETAQAVFCLRLCWTDGSEWELEAPVAGWYAEFRWKIQASAGHLNLEYLRRETNELQESKPVLKEGW